MCVCALICGSMCGAHVYARVCAPMFILLQKCQNTSWGGKGLFILRKKGQSILDVPQGGKKAGFVNNTA